MHRTPFLTSRLNILGVLSCGKTKIWVPGQNIITTVGGTFYTEWDGPFSVDFTTATAGLVLGSGDTEPTASDTDVVTEFSQCRKSVTSGYPKVSDDDEDNRYSGSDVVTWLYEYTVDEGIASGILEGAIVNSLTAPTKALCRFLFARPWAKTEVMALKIFINHSGLASGTLSDADGPEGIIEAEARDSDGAAQATWATRFPPFHKRDVWS